MASPPQPPSHSRVREFWRRRSRKGKAAIVLGALVAIFIAIGLAAPPPDEEKPDVAAVVEEVEAAPEQPTSEAEAAATTTAGGDTTTEEAEAPPPRPPRVARVIDGDTLELDSGATVRLVQIDAPERKGECYGRKAGTVLRQLLPHGSKVRVVRDPKLDNVDRYGRLLRYIFTGKTNINLALVQRGAASVWFFEGDRGRYAAKLLAAAESARADGKGAWGACRATLDPSRAFRTRPKPPPSPPPAEPQPANCHPSYKGACLDPNASDYDCAGGSGNGPEYTGTVQVVGYDEYGLDADGDGYGCE